MVTFEDVKAYSGIDDEDESTKKNVERLLAVAKKFVQSSIGDKVDLEDERVEMIILCIVNDFLDDRSYMAVSVSNANKKISNSTRKLISDFAMQLRMELRKSGVSDASLQ